MKLRIIGFFILAVATLSAIISACGNNNSSPTAPSAPAATATFTITNTPCLAGGNTCTPTLSFTNTATKSPTNTATISPTSTPSNTATLSPTKTPSNSPTNSPTLTATNSPSNSPTSTPTLTPCGYPGPLCTDTFTPLVTNTFTPSPTKTPTNSPTNSPTATPTNTSCGVPAATATPNAGVYSITGTLTDSTGGTYNSTNPLVILFVDTGSSNGDPASGYVNASTGSYGVIGIAASSNYIPVFWHNAVGDGHTSHPHVGDYAAIGGTATCLLNNGTPVNINGVLTGQNYSFSETNQLSGYFGTISYTGGTVSYCHELQVQLYKPNTVTAGNDTTAQGSDGSNYLGSANNGAITSSGVRYDAIPYKSTTSMCSTQNVDVLAYYDDDGNYSISTGDHYILLSNVSTSISTSHTINLNGSSTW